MRRVEVLHSYELEASSAALPRAYGGPREEQFPNLCLLSA